MADIANLVEYSKAFPVPLKHGGNDIGITINILSFDSEDVVKATRGIDARRVAALYGPKAEEIQPEEIVTMSDQAERERLIAAIQSWDFGEHTFGELSAASECNDANKRYLVNHPNALWIRHQLISAGNNIVNFTNAPATTSRGKSKTK